MSESEAGSQSADSKIGLFGWAVAFVLGAAFVTLPVVRIYLVSNVAVDLPPNSLETASGDFVDLLLVLATTPPVAVIFVLVVSAVAIAFSQYLQQKIEQISDTDAEEDSG